MNQSFSICVIANPLPFITQKVTFEHGKGEGGGLDDGYTPNANLSIFKPIENNEFKCTHIFVGKWPFYRNNLIS